MEAAQMDARATLEERFFELLDDPSETAVDDQLAAHPDTPRVVVDYLRARYVEGVQPADAWERLDLLHRVMRIYLTRADDATRAELLGVALNADRPTAMRMLADLVLFTVPPDDAARACIAALAADQPAARRFNAGELAYHTFDAAGDGYAPNDDLAVVLAETRRAYHRDAAAAGTAA